jgi:hypothetical protein
VPTEVCRTRVPTEESDAPSSEAIEHRAGEVAHGGHVAVGEGAEVGVGGVVREALEVTVTAARRGRRRGPRATIGVSTTAA